MVEENIKKEELKISAKKVVKKNKRTK